MSLIVPIGYGNYRISVSLYIAWNINNNTENKSLLDSQLKNHDKMETKIIRKLDQVIQFPQVTAIDQIRHEF